MVTGHGDEETAARSFRSRASGYVVKDAKLPEMLVDAVEKAAEITNTIIATIERLLESPKDLMQLREMDLAQLVEIGDIEISAVADGALLCRKLFEQDAKQRSFA